MKQYMNLILIVFFTVITVNAEEKAISKNADFSIKALYDAKKPHSEPLIMTLSKTDKFSQHVRVDIQEYKGSLKEYAGMSILQFEKAKFKILKSDLAKNAIVLEYTGITQGGITLHFYTKACKKGNQMFVVTASATETQWKETSKALIDCVESFTLNKK